MNKVARFCRHTALLLAVAIPTLAQADPVVGVSWSNFQEERWKTDEAAIKNTLDAAGASYLSADAGGSAEKQLADIESLITRGAEVLIVLAWDSDAILPAVARAQAEGIPVVAYDRLIEAQEVFYITFDNVEVGRIQAREVLKHAPEGNYVLIKGASTDPNADFLAQGQKEVLQPKIDSGEITIVGEQYTEGWRPEVAQRNMEQILTANDNAVDAVLAANDGTAGGVVAALQSQGITDVPVSGQDADHAALNRVARGVQTVSVWKDSRELGKRAAEVALALAGGTALADVEGAGTWDGGPKGISMASILLAPVPITRDNLDAVVDAGWITREAVCREVTDNPPAVCQ